MTKGKDVGSKARALQALDLRIAGATYQQISDNLGYGGKGNAHNAVSKLLNETQAEGVDELRTLGQGRYEYVIRQMMRTLGNPESSDNKRFMAADRIIRAQDSLNRLFGLNRETPTVDARTQTLIVEAETLTNNMRAALGHGQPVELGPVVDVEVNED